MPQYIVEYTWLVYRDEALIDATSPERAAKTFRSTFPGVGGNGRVVSVRPVGTEHTTNFLARLSYAREKGKPYVYT